MGQERATPGSQNTPPPNERERVPLLSYVTLALANASDIGTTLALLNAGVPEKNPFMNFAIEQYGAAGLILPKIAAVAVIFAVTKFAEYKGDGRSARNFMNLANLAYILVVAWNIFSPI